MLDHVALHEHSERAMVKPALCFNMRVIIRAYSKEKY